MIGNLTTAALFQAEYHQVARLTVLREDAPVIYAILSDNSRKLLTQVVISDDSVVNLDGVTFENDPYHFNESHIFTGGLTVDQYSITGDRIEIGSAVAAELTLHLKNSDGLFDPMVFAGREIAVEIGTKNWESDNDPITYIPLGIYKVDSEPKNGDEINITALDRMVSKFDNEIDWTQFTFPMDVETLVSTVCTICGVTCVTDISRLPNASYTINYAPASSCTMYRELIQWAALLTATCALFDENGDLRFRWYTPSGFELTPANRFSHEIENTDITLTGIHYKDEEGEEILVGTADYTLEVSGCGILQNDVSSALDNILDAVEDFSYRPFEASIITAPFLQPLDMISFTDARGNDHTCIISHVTYVLNDSTNVAGVGNTKVSTEYTPQSGLTTQQKEAVNDARRQAINYLASDDTGIMVANMSDGARYTPSDVPSGVKNTFIDEDSFDVRDGTDTLASFGEESQIGTDDNTHVRFNDRGVAVFDAGGNERISIGASQKKSYKIRKFINVTYDEHHSFFHYTIPGSLDPEKPITIMWPHTNSVVFHYGTAESKDLTTSMTSSYYHIYYDGAYSLTISGAGGTLFADIYYFPDDAFGLTIGTRDEAGEYADKSVSVGDDNIVSGEGAVAFGVGLKAQYDTQAVFGEYNNNVETHILEAGNGDSDEDRSNAFVVYKSGEVGCFVDTDTLSGVDYDLCEAATNLGWNNIISVSLLQIKRVIANILQMLVTSPGTGTVANNYSSAAFKSCQLTKVGKTVTMMMNLGYTDASNTIAMSDTMFTIPAAFRPSANTTVPCMMARGSNFIPIPGNVTVKTDGTIVQSSSSGVTGIYCVATWMTS